jgi:PPM family protein phosphatase
MSIKKSICSIASLTNKSENQDCSSIFHNSKLGINGLAIADGIGSFKNAKEASEFAVNFIKFAIEELNSLEDLNFEFLFKRTKERMIEVFCSDTENTTETYGTTLLVILEYELNNYHQIKFAYVGNGSIWHLRGNFNHFNESQLLPWNSINYLNPHSIQQDGKDALYKLISVSPKFEEAIPTVFNLRSDENFGDIFMVCTDGIYSYDQIQIGKDNIGKTWISGETSMALFYSYLNKYFKIQDAQDSGELTQVLEDYLKRLNETEELDDDATLGVLILPKVFEYQNKVRNANYNSQ